jgi:hypothetical protein
MLAENVLCKLIKRTVPDNRCDCLVDRRQLRLLASNTSECTLANLPGDAVEPFGVVMWSHSHEEDVGFTRRVPISFVSGNGDKCLAASGQLWNLVGAVMSILNIRDKHKLPWCQVEGRTAATANSKLINRW